MLYEVMYLFTRDDVQALTSPFYKKIRDCCPSNLNSFSYRCPTRLLATSSWSSPDNCG